MVDLILKNTQNSIEIQDQYDLETLVENICDFPEVVAIIDTGAILSRDSNREFAVRLLNARRFHEKKLKGVIYYDIGSDRSSKDEWMIYENDSKAHLPRKDSAIPDCDAFIIYDDARTRGSDFKLKHSAVAFLTLGTCLTKDKFMQGAGRLRQLGQDQKLVLIGTREVWSEIDTLEGGLDHSDTSKTTKCVLHWIMMNTEEEIEHALLEYLMQGEVFAQSRLDPKNNFVKIMLI
jgi:hypothetical protein